MWKPRGGRTGGKRLWRWGGGIRDSKGESLTAWDISLLVTLIFHPLIQEAKLLTDKAGRKLPSPGFHAGH